MQLPTNPKKAVDVALDEDALSEPAPGSVFDEGAAFLIISTATKSPSVK